MKDITEGQFLKVLENLSVKVIARNQAQRILQTIESNPLHKIFVAVQKNIVIGAVTLLVEPKFILRRRKSRSHRRCSREKTICQEGYRFQPGQICH